jgi:hypothetical protein
MSTEANIIREYNGVKIAVTPDYRFAVVESELFNGERFRSLKAVEKEIDTRLDVVAKLHLLQKLQVQAPLLVLDKNGNECEVTFDGKKLCGLSEPSEEDSYSRSRFRRRRGCIFYPRADWIVEAITKARGLEAELEVLRLQLRDVKRKLHAVETNERTCDYTGDNAAEEFGALLEAFEKKRKLAEAGPPVNGNEEDDEYDDED